MKLKKYILLFTFLFTVVFGAISQDAISGKEEKRVVEAISDTYNNWNRAGWNGKISADILPVSATMKVYMEKGKLTLISIRAPFIGEVGRIEVDKDSLLVVNKMKRRYYSKSIAEISQMVPDLTEDFQALLLGRMFVIGEGQLGKKSLDSVSVFPSTEEGCYMIVPSVPDYLPEVLYGFGTDSAMQLSTFVCAYGREAVPVEGTEELDVQFQYEPKVQVQADVVYRDNGGARAELSGSFNGRNYTASLTSDAIEWGAKGFDRISVKGYSRCGIREVLRF